ncbi:HEPN domain-containing protein [Rubrivirga sp. S365]|uniref:HEPN domain-containing protein n=1 Tax=Rubrivirga litoralis TaxID=3075598 RepID=A0ABU3BTS9_9BACT|nr:MULTISPECIES: HEPN domain-containing protein [unclassified Rubrivirga]MDT0632698.1 HEPN domain-containing protein [Rubrivirga sp. F394]MDT7857836.1 HEPN domain-containing protein [Rubrivirga sp. S365]
MSAETLREASRWLRYAQEDLATARALTGTSSVPPRHAAWLAQQAAEKAIKAVLIALQIPFPFVHDLDRLVALVPEAWGVCDVDADLTALTEFAVDARYPDDLPDVSAPEAQAGVVDAERVVASVESQLVPWLRAWGGAES